MSSNSASHSHYLSLSPRRGARIQLGFGWVLLLNWVSSYTTGVWVSSSSELSEFIFSLYCLSRVFLPPSIPCLSTVAELIFSQSHNHQSNKRLFVTQGPKKNFFFLIEHFFLRSLSVPIQLTVFSLKCAVQVLNQSAIFIKNMLAIIALNEYMSISFSAIRIKKENMYLFR